MDKRKGLWVVSPEAVVLTEEREPSPQELAQVEAEWPLIAAELALVDSEVAALAAAPSDQRWARRRVRRAEARVAAEAAAWAARTGVLAARGDEQVQVVQMRAVTNGVAA